LDALNVGLPFGTHDGKLQVKGSLRLPKRQAM